MSNKIKFYIRKYLQKRKKNKIFSKNCFFHQLFDFFEPKVFNKKMEKNL